MQFDRSLPLNPPYTSHLLLKGLVSTDKCPHAKPEFNLNYWFGISRECVWWVYQSEIYSTYHRFLKQMTSFTTFFHSPTFSFKTHFTHASPTHLVQHIVFVWSSFTQKDSPTCFWQRGSASLSLYVLKNPTSMISWTKRAMMVFIKRQRIFTWKLFFFHFFELSSACMGWLSKICPPNWFPFISHESLNWCHSQNFHCF